jgi:DNA-directed RNA polymerase specialized sigma24 family protein
MTDEAKLLRRYAEEKSEAAFAELVRRRIDFVYAVALRKVGGDAHLAEDVAQQVFVDLARKAAKLAHHAVLSGWLFTSTHYAATQLVRAERRRRAREAKAEAMNQLWRETEHRRTRSACVRCSTT